jgi:aspartate kinase
MINQPIRIFKFGGASLKDADGFRNVVSILEKYKDKRLVIVVSAIGKTTNALEEVVEAHSRQTGEARQLLEKIKADHFQLAAELLGDQHEIFDLINDIFVEADWVLEEEPYDNYDYMYDQIVCIGELASSRLVSAFLKQEGLSSQWIDARDIILTDNIYREGWVKWQETVERARKSILPLTERPGFVLTQGFIGSTTENFTTTLGREGSDYTAAILSFCLDAQDMTIWKDVPGVLTADPRYFENATKLDNLSYKEAIEMTYYGAKVIHPKTIKPLQNKSIPLYVKSFIQPDEPGTMIAGEVEDIYPPMIAVESNQALLHIATRDFSFVAEHHLSILFQRIADLHLQINMMQNTAISFAVCINNLPYKVNKFVESIQDEFKVMMEEGLEVITVRHYQESLLESLKEGKIVLLEERIRNTVKMVVKDVPKVIRKQ